jgi:tetratricopeptide (TPR) repeat protein
MNTASVENLTNSTHFKTAFALHQQGQLVEAEEMYRTILAIEPNHFDAIQLLGVIHLARGQYEAAEQQIRLAIAIDPNHAFLHNNRGNALRNLRRCEAALESYNEALALKPDYAEAFNNRGNALLDLERAEEALNSYDKALTLRPDYAEALNNRGNALRKLQRLEDAVESFEKAITHKPDYEVAVKNRARTLHDLGYSDYMHPNLLRLHPIDLCYGTDTSGYVSKARFGPIGLPIEQINNYAGTQPSIVRQTLRMLPDLRGYCFFDLGCGKGRAVVVASEFPFEKIVGVEISSELANIAKKNADVIQAHYPLRTPIEIITGNAIDVTPMEGKIVLFMYNPFGDELMKQLRENLERRLQNEIQHIFVIYHNALAGHIFDSSVSLKRWHVAQLVCEAAEQDFAYPCEGVTVIWQSNRNAL